MKAQRLAYTITEAREALGGISQPTIYALIAAGDLVTFTIGRRRLVSESALRELIARREKEGKTPSARACK